MRRYADATPCPAPNLSLHSNRYSEHGRPASSIYAPTYGTDDTTTHLEYTTELHVQRQPSLRHAQPRRPMRAPRKSAFEPSLDIFEDVAQEEEQQKQQEQRAVDVTRRSRASVVPGRAVEKKTDILARPAQRMHLSGPAVKPQRRRVSQLLEDRQTPEVNATVQLQEDVLDMRDMLRKQGPRKDPRRRTIYIPSDDTTVMTIHPGQGLHKSRNPREKAPNTGLELVTLSEEEPDNLVPVLKKEKKAPRVSLAVPPKRGPLQQSTRPLQAASFTGDVFGKGGGKENIPPGVEISIDFPKDDPKKPKPTGKPARVHFNTAKAEPVAHIRTKTVGTQKRLRPQLSLDHLPEKSIKAKADGTASRKAASSSLRETISKARMANLERAPLPSSPFHTDRSPPAALRRQKKSRAPSDITMMHVVGKPQELREKYPVLAQDLTRPELYEDHWLTYQEIAITQLLNSLFESSAMNPDADQNVEDLRTRMLALYQDPAIPTLHKRLQASLLCGALSVPKDLLAQTPRLKDDVGLRKKYLNLWVKTYDLTALRAAAEAIVGRQINVPSRLSTGSTCSDDGSRQFRSERRAIEAFLDTFFIKNEDAVRVKSSGGSIANITRGDQHGDEFGSPSWAWRRTMLRSLMLIFLLDKAKTANALPSCLFQISSPHKTSVGVLHALSNMLLPTVGDITRPLGHFHYKVEHAQFPLQEYTYHIENIAVDLRDGVVLTRLVELLLYPSSTLVSPRDSNVTVSMPSGEILTSTFDFDQKESWVLSQHLKFPSIGRAQKMYNVQIALSALTGVRGIPVQAVDGIRAEDIVDGHREKTLSLLWALVGKCGLSTLVDWPQMVKEIDRFRDSWYTSRVDCDLDSDDEDATAELSGLEYHKRLLLSWSRSIARFHGLRVSNLTTSFSNPRVLECIVDTYLPSALLPASNMGLGTSNTTHPQLSLAAKLRATGCSTSFIALFAQNTNTIPSRDFTLLALSFLASRLLPLSLTHRAATTIQRAYRRRLARQTVHKRVVLMKIAADCADVARKRERLVCAALVIQTRWRRVLEDRKRRLEAEIEAFQALARGWAIRRWARRATGGKVGGKEKVRRIRGGW